MSYLPETDGVHTTVYVPSSLSVTRARTVDAPRQSTRKGSPPLCKRTPIASKLSMVNDAL